MPRHDKNIIPDIGMYSATEKIETLRKVVNYILNDRKPLLFEYLTADLPSEIKVDALTIKKENLTLFLTDIIHKIDQETPKEKRRQISIPLAENLLPEIKKIQKIYNNSPLFDLIITGSYADRTPTPMSDVDTIVILKRDTLKDVNKLKKAYFLLRKLNSFAQSIDPTQHHGHWIFTEFDLQNYDASIMPLQVYSKSVSIGRNLTLDFFINQEKTTSHLQHILSANLENGKRLTEMLYDNKCNLYYLKDLVSTISLIPALLFQNYGIHISKKEAIDRADEIFNERTIKVLQWATHVRKEWDSLPNFNLTKYIFKNLSKIIENRNIIEKAVKTMPALSYEDVKLKDLTKNDFIDYFDCLKQQK